MAKPGVLALPLLLLAVSQPAEAAEKIGFESVNAAKFDESSPAGSGNGTTADPLTVKLQILLDRNHMSPGVIDGKMGENVSKAISAFEELRGLDMDGKLDRTVWAELGGDNSGDVLTRYKVTEEDLKENFVGDIPDDFREMASMKELGYSSPVEMLAERFHMEEALLKSLNPKIESVKAGDEIVVANIDAEPEGKVASIRVETSKGLLHGLDKDGKLVVAYPATVGSRSSPSPSGVHKIKAVALDAAYYYDPEKNFKVDGIEEKLKLPPGPNNPIGSVWIGLDEPTYGIHGAPEPEKIDKEPSQGCVRLTNWDAEELAGLVKPGVEVAFVD